MQHQDAKHEQLAAEFMREIIGMTPKDEDAIKGTEVAAQSLLERVEALKKERNTILQQAQEKQLRRKLAEQRNSK